MSTVKSVLATAIKWREVYMKNKMEDLNNHLFAQLERLGDEDLTDEKLEKEIHRSKAISSIARNLADNAKLQLEAQKLFADGHTDSIPKLLGA